VVWSRELESDRRLPDDVIKYWTESPRDEHHIVRERMRTDDWEIPADRGLQISMLQLLTGSHGKFQKDLAKHTSKDTYVLLSAIHSFRNRSQHSGGQAIDVGVAVAALMLCIEMLACLAHEQP
jgi:hypothetical protein